MYEYLLNKFSVSGLVGSYAGALLITYLMTRLIRWIAKRFTNNWKAVNYLPFAIGSLLNLNGTSWGAFAISLLIYEPCIFLWMLFDMRKDKRSQGSH